MAGAEARTPNTRFWRPVLYQLNYAPIGIKNWRNGRDSNPRPCVTGRYSNQLNYHSAKWGMIGSDLLSLGEAPHYHRRNNVSLLSSIWIPGGTIALLLPKFLFVNLLLK